MNETVRPPVSHDMMANAIRFLAADAVEKANSGHPGMPMGMADVATVLFTEFLKFDAAHPHWPDRDRFVLSAGHGSMLLYACMYLTGYPDMPIEQIKQFRQLHSKTPGHPEYRHTLGVESTTGPLGQGVATSIGMAIAERDLNDHYGPELVDHHTWVICGDGCLMEGVSHEAIDLAGHLKLKKLTILWDNNHITIDGATSLATSCNQLERFAAHGWHTIAIDGHNPAEIRAAMAEAKAQSVPTFIACHTTIGFGAPTKAGTAGVHGSPLGAAELAGAREKLGWPYPPFEVPAECLAVWRKAGSRGAPEREAWLARYTGSEKRAALEFALDGAIPAGFEQKYKEYKASLITKAPNVATRKSSEMALEVINAEIPIALGGSADLTHSNLTLTKGIESLTGEDFSGRYVRYGIREFGMSAAMNGIAVHGGFIPFGGTFACFSDYARGAIRLSALMGIGVIYVLTHDLIGLGEDGPTHQPIEHYAMLRATPNLHVFRPADAVETAECWEIALHSTQMPSVLLLSRQNLPTLRKSAEENLSAKGGYVLQEADGKRDVTLIATGSEVSLAVEAAKALAGQGKKAAVVSLPSFDLFEKQDAAYRGSVLGAAPRIAIEAATRFGWDRYIGENGGFIGMHGFGASAPAGELYKFFGITADAAVAKALELIG